MTDIDLAPLTAAKVDRVTADGLIAGPRTITITNVESEVYEGKQIASLSFAGDDRMPFKPCKTMLRLIAAVWGPRTSQWVGRSMTLYRDPKVTFGADTPGGVRISHMSHMERDAEVILTLKKGKKGVVRVKPLATQQRQAPEPEQHDAQTVELPPIDKAAQWADATLAAIAATADRAALAELQQASQKALAKLSAQRPELSELVSMAFVERLGVFSAGDVAEPELDDAPF